MASQVGLVFLVVAFAAMFTLVHSSTMDQASFFRLGMEPDGHGMVADSLDPEDELMMESETSRRQLAQGKYISYGALAQNNVPCNQRGQSYYNCNSHQQANPYTRGCTRATRCARNNR